MNLMYVVIILVLGVIFVLLTKTMMKLIVSGLLLIAFCILLYVLVGNFTDLNVGVKSSVLQFFDYLVVKFDSLLVAIKSVLQHILDGGGI